MLKIAKNRLNELYAKIDETMGLFIPIKRAGEVNYAVWKDGKEVSFKVEEILLKEAQKIA